jgi:hypothetical protein
MFPATLTSGFYTALYPVSGLDHESPKVDWRRARIMGRYGNGQIWTMGGYFRRLWVKQRLQGGWRREALGEVLKIEG